MKFSTVKIEVYLPAQTLPLLQRELDRRGLCRVGAYSHVMAVVNNTGYFKPLDGSCPYVGEPGALCAEPELKAEFPCPADRVEEAVEAIRAVHPYEEPVWYVIPVLNEIDFRA